MFEENYLSFNRHIGTEFKLKHEMPEEILSVALERPYGPEIKLVIDFNKGCYVMDDPDLAFVKEVLFKYKNNITGVKIPLYHDRYDYLLEEDFYLKDLEQIDLHLRLCDNEDCHSEHLDLVIQYCNSFIPKYADKLKHLGIHGMHSWQEDDNEIIISSDIDIAPLPNIKSFSLSSFIFTGSSSFVNFESITNLKLYEVEVKGIDKEDFEFRNLSVLSLRSVEEGFSVALLKKNSRSLTKLKIRFDHDDYFRFEGDSHYVYKDIKFYKLKNLEIVNLYETVALTIIQNARNSLEEIHICDFVSKDVYQLQFGSKFKLPCVKKINFKIDFEYLLSSKLVWSLINACNENTVILLNNERICKPLLEYLREECV